jgi:hypothetical protein
MSYDNVTIRMGADATQALSVIERVKAAMGGMRNSFVKGFPLLGRLGGGGIAGGIAGMAGMAAFGAYRRIMDSVTEGFEEVVKGNHSYTMALEAMTVRVKEIGTQAAHSLIPAMSEAAHWWNLVSEDNKRQRAEMKASGFTKNRGRGLMEERLEARYAKYGEGPITTREQETFDADLAAERKRVGWKAPVDKQPWKTFIGPMPPFGFEEDRKKREEREKQQLAYTRETVATLKEIERDISMTEMFDPW